MRGLQEALKYGRSKTDANIENIIVVKEAKDVPYSCEESIGEVDLPSGVIVVREANSNNPALPTCKDDKNSVQDNTSLDNAVNENDIFRESSPVHGQRDIHSKVSSRQESSQSTPSNNINHSGYQSNVDASSTIGKDLDKANDGINPEKNGRLSHASSCIEEGQRMNNDNTNAQCTVINVKETPDNAIFEPSNKVQSVVSIGKKELQESGKSDSVTPAQPGTTKERKKKKWSAFSRKPKCSTSKTSNQSASAKLVPSSESQATTTTRVTNTHDNNEDRQGPIKTSTFHRFISYVSKKFKIERKSRNRVDTASADGKSLKTVIGMTTTGHALVLINEVEETKDMKTPSTCTAKGPVEPGFDLLDCGLSKLSQSSGDLSNDRFKIPSPDFEPLKVYDSVDDCVEGLFQNMLKNNDDVQWVSSQTSLEAARPTPAPANMD